MCVEHGLVRNAMRMSSVPLFGGASEIRCWDYPVPEHRSPHRVPITRNGRDEPRALSRGRQTKKLEHETGFEPATLTLAT